MHESGGHRYSHFPCREDGVGGKFGEDALYATGPTNVTTLAANKNTFLQFAFC